MKKDTRLYTLIVKSTRGDIESYTSIMNRFLGLIIKEYYDKNKKMVDDDLQSEIYLKLFIRIQNFKIYSTQE